MEVDCSNDDDNGIPRLPLAQGKRVGTNREPGTASTQLPRAGAKSLLPSF